VDVFHSYYPFLAALQTPEIPCQRALASVTAEIRVIDTHMAGNAAANVLLVKDSACATFDFAVPSGESEWLQQRKDEIRLPHFCSFGRRCATASPASFSSHDQTPEPRISSKPSTQPEDQT
jgi:hypothetical protein